MPLFPCESCRRHVYAHERSCRFCGTLLPLAAGLLVATAIGLASCSPAPKYGGPPPPDVDSPRETPTTTEPVPVPAPEPTPEPSTAPAPDPPPPEDDGSNRDLYGAPPAPDRDR